MARFSFRGFSFQVLVVGVPVGVDCHTKFVRVTVAVDVRHRSGFAREDPQENSLSS